MMLVVRWSELLNLYSQPEVPGPCLLHDLLASHVTTGQVYKVRKCLLGTVFHASLAFSHSL